MKNNKAILLTLPLLVIFLIAKSPVYADKFFDGGYGYDAGHTYGGSNVPMPATPSPPPSYSNSGSYSSSNSQSKHKSAPVHKHTDYSWADQASSDIVNSIFNSYKQKEEQEKQAAIAAQKKAEAEKKAAEAKKKAESQKWIQEYLNDSSVVKLDNQDAGVNPADLKKSDPKIWGSLNSIVPSMSDSNTPPLVEKSAVKKFEEAAIPSVKMDDSKTQPKPPKPDQCALSESQLRAEYYSVDRKLGECMSGSIQCSPEEVKVLEVKREAAQNGLNLHYNYKYDSNGNFIKNPYN